MPVSFYTPTTAGTVPKANMATSLLPALGQGLLQAAQMYQNVKAVDKAATEAATLFKDPVYANIFRQVGLSAVRNGESPAPVIQNMLSTAIKLKSDEEQAAQRERMMRLQFGQSMALENLRTKNNLMQQDDQQAFQTEYGSPEAIQGRESAQAKGRLMGQAQFATSPEGQAMATAQAKTKEQERADAIERAADIARETTRARIGTQREMGVLPERDWGDEDPLDSALSLFEMPISEMPYSELEKREAELLQAIEKEPKGRARYDETLKTVRDQKKILEDNDKRRAQVAAKKTKDTPAANVSPAANRYITP
jgi:hypothetical protein